MPYCEVSPGVRVYYEDFGEGPAIVFICGAQMTHKFWETQVAAVAGDFRTIAFDWRGTGTSDKPRNGYTGETAAADVCALIERLELGSALLVGHGLGTHLALLAAEAKPPLVKGLFLASTAPWFSGERDGKIGGVTEAFLDSMISQRKGAAAGNSVPYAQSCFELGDKWVFHRPQSPGVYQAMLEQALAWPQYVINAYADSMRDIDHRARSAKIRCPTVIAQGRHDRKQRYEGAVHFARLIPGARLVTFENSAHMSNIEEIDVFNAALSAFARTIQQGRQAA